MKYFHVKDFERCLRELKVCGGTGQKVAAKVESMLGGHLLGFENVLKGKETNHGETRIKNCIKYDLGDGHRLVTIQTQNSIVLCFVGDHEDSDKWLERNKGLKILQNSKGELSQVRTSVCISERETMIDGYSDGTKKKLVFRLKPKDYGLFKSVVPSTFHALLEAIDSEWSDEQIIGLCDMIPDRNVATCAYDILVHLKEGNIDQAKDTLDLFMGNAAEISNMGEEEILEVLDGDTVKRMRLDSEEYVKWYKNFLNSATYQEWMLFMHPEQQKMVDADFIGPAKLSGVSGSGKTCVIVNRALRLAQKRPALPVLILTLNKSLAALIRELVNHACNTHAIECDIEVKSFFELCQELLHRFEPQHKNLYGDVTTTTKTNKSGEHIDDIWREFYQCERNNPAAEVLLPIHKSLNFQFVSPSEYLRQEFDWIRSLLPKSERMKYLEVDRKGRTLAFSKQWREIVLNGLVGWEQKMDSVGIADYLGLSTHLFKHIDSIRPSYSSILIDEAQDFGTMELKLIRRMVAEGDNDLFLCGDMAQHVLPKHSSFKGAGIEIPPARSHVILKNYRNSREILEAAYNLLVSNLEGDVLMDSELEILDPEFANFSTANPYVLRADSLEDEISFALNYMSYRSNKSETKHKGCIAIAGYTLHEIQSFAAKLEIPVLDGAQGLLEGALFFSDLDQTKGYEFDTVCILNCRAGVLPSPESPAGEHYRDACRLYVAMTRAKRDLILSYSGEACSWLINCKGFMDFDEWAGYIDESDLIRYGEPERGEARQNVPVAALALNGRKFLYTKHVLGSSIELQDKLDDLIDGVGRSRDGQAVAWKNVRDAYNDVLTKPIPKQLFGPKTHKEFLDIVNNLST